MADKTTDPTVKAVDPAAPLRDPTINVSAAPEKPADAPQVAEGPTEPAKQADAPVTAAPPPDRTVLSPGEIRANDTAAINAVLEGPGGDIGLELDVAGLNMDKLAVGVAVLDVHGRIWAYSHDKGTLRLAGRVTR